MRRLRKEEESENGETPKTAAKQAEGYVFLFTGYMVSNAFKMDNQFPPEKEKDIKAAIRNVLGKYKAGPNDLAIVTGMDAGSEILFVECCVASEIPVEVYFAIPEAPYVSEFVSPGGEEWTERFYKMKNNPLVDEYYQPDHVGPPKNGDDVHERNNRWALYSALTRGIDKLRLIAVWDGKSEIPRDRDARLVKHMIDLMRETGGIIEHINSIKLTSIALANRPETPPNSTAPKSKSSKRIAARTNGSKDIKSKKTPAD
jgi:hypothetical protein